jgi:hypothetical protein
VIARLELSNSPSQEMMAVAQPWRGWNGPWMAFGLLPQIDWAKCAAGNLLGVIPLD